jgi:hypothetical protein
MNINNILKVKFLKSDETINPNPFFHKSIIGSNITEIDIELDDLIKLISDVENIRGLGKSLHKEAYTGIDYLGNEVVFSSYVVWVESGDIYKYNFDEEWIPLNSFIIKQKRDEVIKKLTNL